jgi:hypothetical protein
MSDPLRKQVVGVTLFGDPLYLKGQTINRVNNSANLYNGVALPVDRANAGVPDDMVAKTGNYCKTLDPVCQFSSTILVSLLLRVHEHYVPDGDAVKAADFVSPKLPTPTASATIPYGRNAPTYTSYPNDPTPTSKWVASAQGEGLPDAAGEITQLRGRAAVQETFGIKRVRIYEVTLQRLVNGAWQTVAQRTADVVNESSRAYAVAYTPPKRLCQYGSGTRTYRVVNSHGVRRSDDVIADRVTYSKNFVSRMVEGDTGCPMGTMSIFPNGTPPSLMYRWQSARLATDLAYFSEDPTPAPGQCQGRGGDRGHAARRAGPSGPAGRRQPLSRPPATQSLPGAGHP